MRTITIRDVPDEVCDELTARAARRGQSMQEYLRDELIARARRESRDEWSARVRERVARSGVHIDRELIIEMLDEERAERCAFLTPPDSE